METAMRADDSPNLTERPSRGKRPGRSGGRRRENPALSGESLAAYRRVLRDTPPLDVKDELERARELFNSRRAFARCIKRLPAEARESVLNGDPRGPERGHNWPLEYLEACCERLSRYENGDGDARMHELIAEAKHHKRRLDGARPERARGVDPLESARRGDRSRPSGAHAAGDHNLSEYC